MVGEVLIRLGRRYRHLPVRRGVASVVAYGLLKFAAPVLRTRMAPSLRDLVSAGHMEDTAEAFVRALLGEHAVPAADLARFTEEFVEVRTALLVRARAVDPEFPAIWAIGDRSALALYLIVRLTRPVSVVETGVASGHSSSVILAALKANGHGRLHSYDVLAEAGYLVPRDLHDRWTLEILRRADPISDLNRRLERVQDVDIFFHDADHSYVGQSADYCIGARALATGSLGLLLSDDVDESFAFLDLIESRCLAASLLVDARKVFGACRLSAPTR